LRSTRILLPRADLLVPATGAAATLIAAYLSVRSGAQIGFGLVLLVSLFIGAVLGFLFVPHLMLAATIPLFALIPAAKLFVSPKLGPLKDLVSLAAIIAAAAVIALERRPGRKRVLPDGWVLLGVAFLLGLYFVNVGGGHDIAWAQGFRLTGEPLLLLVAGLTLPDPRRTLRFALPVLVATACFEALYGLLQQAVGPWTLVGWGYSFAAQLRSYNGHLRSFGTMEDAFAYAAFLLFGLAAVLFWMRRGPLAATCAALITAGVVGSYVRTAALIVVALIGLWIGRKGYTTSAVLVVAAAVAAGASTLVTSAGASATTSYESQTSSLTLNGRTSAWKAALGSPASWPFGQGVGEIGTAAERATYKLTPGAHHEAPTRAVDSGYLATIADVGLVGAATLLFILGRLIAIAVSAARRGRAAAWVALGLITVILLDAVTRSSFTGFPTAFLGLLFVGVALAAATLSDRSAEDEPVRRRPALNAPGR
jgi:O-antigen ligase